MTETCTTCGFNKPCLPTCPGNTAVAPVAAPEPAPKREKPLSRPTRWHKAVAAAESAIGDLRSALEELSSVHEEYQDWLNNLPENLQNSALGEKLQTIDGIDVSSALSYVDDIESTVDEASGADLPLGFGRD